MSNAERLIATYNRIDKYLRRLTGAGKYTSFGNVVRSAAAESHSVRCYMDDLLEYGDLRNAIVHERTDAHPIAEPYDSTVASFERLCGLLLSPPEIRSVVRHQVVALGWEEPIRRALEVMADKAYSQIPVLKDARIYALLTTNTIALWLAKLLDRSADHFAGTRIADVLRHKEDLEDFALMPVTASVFDVVGVFVERTASGHPIEAVIITQSGRKSEKPLRIVTKWDLSDLRDRVQYKID